MSDAALDQMRELVQVDIGKRGLATDPTRNLLTECRDDFRNACRSLAGGRAPTLAIVTGFFIPTATPPAAETDGPLGALYLARALSPLGFQVTLVTDAFCAPALRVGLGLAGLRKSCRLIVLPSPEEAGQMSVSDYAQFFLERNGNMRPTHLLAIERVGPSHTLESLQKQIGSDGALGETYLDFLHAVPSEHQDRCHTMRGRDITDLVSPAHRLFEAFADDPVITTIGIGDGGNEIGMGKIPWDVIDRNIPGGGLVACRVPTDHLIVAGLSNWGAYALAAGVRLLRNAFDQSIFDVDEERRLLEAMVEHGPLVDGVLGRPEVSVDGVEFSRYAEVLTALARMR
ncbi:MAG: DUF4392 domain-containing protein [Planctomycetes bacterium]|nr:DUF4392 domain-containing protein [Planctomycetota bacterium]